MLVEYSTEMRSYWRVLLSLVLLLEWQLAGFVIQDSGPTFPPSWFLQDQLFPLWPISGKVLIIFCFTHSLLAPCWRKSWAGSICPLASAFCWLQWYFWPESVLAASFPSSHAASASTLGLLAARRAADSNGQTQPIQESCSLHRCWLFRIYINPKIVSASSAFLPSLQDMGPLSPFGSMSWWIRVRGGRWWCSWERRREQGGTCETEEWRDGRGGLIMSVLIAG